LEADNNTFTRQATLRALGVWGTKESVTILLPLVNDENVFVRKEAMTALGNLKDERAAEPIAKRLVELQDRMHASKTLQAMGSKGEKAVQALLKPSDGVVRLEACKILRASGPKASIDALTAAAQDDNRLVANEAKRALEAANGRP